MFSHSNVRDKSLILFKMLPSCDGQLVFSCFWSWILHHHFYLHHHFKFNSKCFNFNIVISTILISQRYVCMYVCIAITRIEPLGVHIILWKLHGFCQGTEMAYTCFNWELFIINSVTSLSHGSSFRISLNKVIILCANLNKVVLFGYYSYIQVDTWKFGCNYIPENSHRK